MQMIAGYNHSLAVNSKGKVYSWGYAGFGMLGRDSKEAFQKIPLAIETSFPESERRLYKV